MMDGITRGSPEQQAALILPTIFALYSRRVTCLEPGLTHDIARLRVSALPRDSRNHRIQRQSSHKK